MKAEGECGATTPNNTLQGTLDLLPAFAPANTPITSNALTVVV
ncbi:MAG: hypothetical protein VYC42_17125 [Pseudomonadota bacterium]|nr:hypothetical protein [Pseudomonadota bacterium]